MRKLRASITFSLALSAALTGVSGEELGPAAALGFEARYRGDVCRPGQLYAYPEARGIPFKDTKNIVEMSSAVWRPSEISADFRRRMGQLPVEQRKQGIIVILKTERCATKVARLCSITTAVFEKEATSLIHSFSIYGVQLKPRDDDTPPGSKRIETGEDEWKNEAAGVYGFLQGPGATIIVLSPIDGSVVARTDAMAMHFFESEFTALSGRTPYLEEFLVSALLQLQSSPDT